MTFANFLGRALAGMSLLIPSWCAAQIGLTSQQRATLTSRASLVDRSLDEALLILARFDLSDPVIETIQGGGPLSSVRATMATRWGNDSEVRVAAYRPIVIRVVTATAGVTARVTVGGRELSTTTSAHGKSGDIVNYGEVLAVAPRTGEQTKVELVVGGAHLSLVIKEPESANFTSSFGAFFVARPGSGPAFGFRKPTFTLGRSSRLTVDAVTLFSGADDISLGAALSYTVLIGRSGYESSKGIFGFPVRMNFTFGFAGLDAARADKSGRYFFGIGFEIPTGGSTP